VRTDKVLQAHAHVRAGVCQYTHAPKTQRCLLYTHPYPRPPPHNYTSSVVVEHKAGIHSFPRAPHPPPSSAADSAAVLSPRDEPLMPCTGCKVQGDDLGHY